MWNQYPPPSYAAHIWTQGQKLFLALPGRDDGSPGHKVAVELDLALLKTMATSAPAAERRLLASLLSIIITLSAREREGREATISTPAAPTQYDLDAIIKSLGGKVTKVQKVPETLTVEDIL